ncbi:MAG TPA: hypothetical protein VFA16_21565, partial [Mycobacterium sp.]|uniref:hypothetical protein n=1 Tax=Mycobacterium sp. TaxID=1785 RepID=UPI002D562970
MNTTHALKTIMVGALVSGGVAVAGVGLAAGTAHAWGGPFTWCPGQPMDEPTGPDRYGNHYSWDMSVCHTWYRVDYGYGNVPRVIENGTSTLQGSSAWDGDNPPPPNPSGFNCGLFWCP